MINTSHILKVTAAWTSIVYVICYLGVALFPGITESFMEYALHTSDAGVGESVMTVGTFVSGLVIWNVIALLAVWLFASLYNGMKR
jgi:hypothetical protein